jgi:hypothetical protein
MRTQTSPSLPLTLSFGLLIAGLSLVSAVAQTSSDALLPLIPNSENGELTDRDISAELKELDNLARKNGTTLKASRTISERPSENLVSKEMLPRIPRFMLISYMEPPYFDIGKGLEIWIDRRTGSRIIVPMRLVRNAYLAAVREGYDISEYYRLPEGSGDFLVFRFTKTASPGSGTFLDGQFTVLLSRSSGKVKRIRPRSP